MYPKLLTKIIMFSLKGDISIPEEFHAEVSTCVGISHGQFLTFPDFLFCTEFSFLIQRMGAEIAAAHQESFPSDYTCLFGRREKRFAVILKDSAETRE